MLVQGYHFAGCHQSYTVEGKQTSYFHFSIHYTKQPSQLTVTCRDQFFFVYQVEG